MYKTSDGKEQEANKELQHFVGQYMNVSEMDAKADAIYSTSMHTVGKLIDDICGHGFHDNIKPEDISNIFQHLTSFKITYERLMENVVRLAKIAHDNIKD